MSCVHSVSCEAYFVSPATTLSESEKERETWVLPTKPSWLYAGKYSSGDRLEKANSMVELSKGRVGNGFPSDSILNILSYNRLFRASPPKSR